MKNYNEKGNIIGIVEYKKGIVYKNGLIYIKDTSGTNINVQVIDTQKIDSSKIPFKKVQRVYRLINSKNLLLNRNQLHI